MTGFARAHCGFGIHDDEFRRSFNRLPIETLAPRDIFARQCRCDDRYRRAPASRLGNGHDPRGQALLFQGLSIALALGLLVLMSALTRARRRYKDARAQAVLLTTVVGTVPGCFYQIQGAQARRVDRTHGSSLWPTDLHDLIVHLDHTDEVVLEHAMLALSRDGQSFALRFPCRWGRTDNEPSLLLDITGNRVTPALDRLHHERASTIGISSWIDLIWVSDVSDRAAASAESSKMAAELRRLKTTVDHVPLTLWWRDSDLKIIDRNRSEAEVLPLTVLAEPLARAAAADGPEAVERKIVASPFNANSSIELREISLLGGELLGIAVDRREVDGVQAELDRLILGHRQVLETVSTAIAIFGPDTHLMFYNSAFTVLWGLEREYLNTEPSLANLLDTLRENRTLPEYADYRQFKADQAALVSTLKSPQQELMHLPDGRTIDCKISRHPFGGLTFIYDDVTGSLDLERSYNTLIAVQRETIDNLFEGIAVFGSDGRLTLWNPAFAETWGVSAEDLESRPHITALVDRARALFDLGTGWDSVRNGLILPVTSYAAHTSQLERRDGRVFKVHGVPLPDGNMLMTYQDTTDSYRVQRALEDRYAALEEAAKLKSEFVANVSYELRTPLNAIIGFAEILTNQFFGALNERQLDYSHGILDGSHRLLALINDVLDLATIESGRMALDIAPIDVHAMLAGILSLTRERIGALPIEVDFDCPTDIGMIEGDERRVRQVLFNLISNALKFTPKTGLISISAKRVDDEIGITIADNGIGIPREDQKRVFEKFERSRSRGEQSGPGLGLPLVKSFVELHGGHIDLVSDPGQGTAITCWLPINHPADVEEMPEN